MADPQAGPSRDRGHEALRQDILAAVADLQLNTGDVQSGLELSDLLFQFVGQLLDSVSALQADIDALQTQVAALQPPAP